jgi:hypothetical protein
LRVFVASSSEQIETARVVADAMAGPSLDVHLWDKGIFEFSSTYIESLERELDRADFAIVIMTGHDVARVRGRRANLPRDNVIFELGLFVGRLGRNRSFFFVDHHSKTRIASDLSGVQAVTYSTGTRGKRGSRQSLRTRAAQVRRQMLPLGARYKPTADDREKQESLWRFSNGVAGCWWERVREESRSALSFVTIEPDPVTNTLSIEGIAYDGKAQPLAEWHTLTTSIVLGPRPRVFYQWEGAYETARGETYGGGAVIRFEGNSGHGYFYDTNFARMKQGARTRIKNVRLYRCTPREAAVMREPWTDEARALLERKLRTLTA